MDLEGRPAVTTVQQHSAPAAPVRFIDGSGKVLDQAPEWMVPLVVQGFIVELLCPDGTKPRMVVRRITPRKTPEGWAVDAVLVPWRPSLARRPLGEPLGQVVSALGFALGLIAVGLLWLLEFYPLYVRGVLGWVLRGAVIWPVVLLGYGVLVAVIWSRNRGYLTTASILLSTTFSLTLAVGLTWFMLRYMVPELPPDPKFPETYAFYLNVFLERITDSRLFAIATAGWAVTLVKVIGFATAGDVLKGLAPKRGGAGAQG